MIGERSAKGVVRRIRPLAHVAVVLCAVVAASCGGDESSDDASDTSSHTTPTAQAERLELVALGDSSADGSGDPTGEGWVGRYAKLLHREHGVAVDVSNLASNGATSADLRSALHGARRCAKPSRRGRHLNHEDCCYPNGDGQQLIARRVLQTGLAPVR